MSTSDLNAAADALAAGDVSSPLASRAPRKGADKPAKAEKTVKIILEDIEEIPPGGQFFSVNGRTFLIKAGVEVEVPECVLDVLDHAVMSVPVLDEMRSVIGYKDRLRFPYRMVRG
ncbi:TPA: hypothetical protein QDE31_01655 [Burkholderia cenocepacia]|uniref:hypothetical protein n=1 Tax=Burkholderia cenocepacia TaxID=95486 RepID=UPI002ABDCA76|nr:hypothetical protein [Burkholderia cenocepacia]HDR9868481.1 hypothetical protein [Burkholderia cenocepacia]